MVQHAKTFVRSAFPQPRFQGQINCITFESEMSSLRSLQRIAGEGLINQLTDAK